MKHIVTTVILLFCVFFQVVAGKLYRLNDASPHLVILIVGYVALFGSRSQALFVAVVGGFLLDFVSLDPWTTNVVSLAVPAWLISRLAASGWAESAVPRGVMMIGGIGLAFAVRGGLLRLYEGVSVSVDHQLFTAIYTLVFGWPFFSVLRSWQHVFLQMPENRVH